MTTAAPLAPPCPAHRTVPATDTCRGCGRFLCGKCEAPESRCPACASTNHPIPWEDRGRGRVRAFFATLRAMPTSGYFSRTPWSGGLKYPLAFAVLCGVVSALGNFLFEFTSYSLISDAHYVSSIKAFAEALAAPAPPEVADMYRAWAAAIGEAVPNLRRMLLLQKAIGLALAPLATLVHVVVMGALTHAVARALGGHGSFEASVRVLAYAQAAVLFSLLPSVGGALAFFSGLLLVTFAAKEAHGLSLGRSFVVAVWWIPVALAFVGLLFVLFLRAMLG